MMLRRFFLLFFISIIVLVGYGLIGKQGFDSYKERGLSSMLGDKKFDSVEAVLQSLQMFIYTQQSFAKYRYHFINTVTKQKTTIHHRNACLLNRQILSVEVNNVVFSFARHCREIL